jgi:hypothetical protein
MRQYWCPDRPRLYLTVGGRVCNRHAVGDGRRLPCHDFHIDYGPEFVPRNISRCGVRCLYFTIVHRLSGLRECHCSVCCTTGTASPTSTSSTAISYDGDPLQDRITSTKQEVRTAHLIPPAAALSPVPKSVRAALADSNWRAAMDQEFAALQ